MMDAIKRFVNTYDMHEAFLNYIAGRIAIAQKNLEQATEVQDIYRYQGQIMALRRLLSIRDEVNKLDK